MRIGDAERTAAMRSLDEHMRAGRLEPEEYADRSAAASVARTHAELEPLFADLPGPSPVPARAADDGRHEVEADEHAPLGGRTGTTIVAAMPFIATGLFFLLLAVGVDMAWLAYLLIPLSGAVVYGGHHERGRRERGRHDRGDRDQRRHDRLDARHPHDDQRRGLPSSPPDLSA